MNILETLIDTSDFPNMLLVGTGKLNTCEDFLRRRYGADSVVWRISHLQETDDDILCSSVGFLLDLRIHRRNIIPIIQTLSTSKNVATGKYNIFVIKHYEELGITAQGSLRRIIERCRDVARFIFLLSGELSSIISPIQSRLQLIRTFKERPSINALYERFKIPTFLPMEITSYIYEELDNYILNSPWNRLIEVREMLFALIDKGYNMRSLMREYLHHIFVDTDILPTLIRNNLPNDFLKNINNMDEHIEKDIYQLEYMLILIKKYGRFK